MSTHAHRSAGRRAALTKIAAPAAAADAAGADTGFLADFRRKGADAVRRLYDAGYYRLPDSVRGALAWNSLTDPAHLSVGLGALGGAHLIGSALSPDKEKGATNRVLRGIAGTGLIGGSLYLGSNPEARNAIRKAVFEFLGKHVASAPSSVKAAETAADPYLDGFCSVAKAYGVDPAALAEYAAAVGTARQGK